MEDTQTATINQNSGEAQLSNNDKKPKKPRSPKKNRDTQNQTQKNGLSPSQNVTSENTSPTSEAKTDLPLRTLIKLQLEYYFSDENLIKDAFLQKEMQKDESGQGYVSLELLATFPRMQKLSNNIEEIRAAVRESEILKLSKSGQRIRRVSSFEAPLTEEQQAEQRTIYVSYLPKNSDKESVKGIFGICGDIRRIDLPIDKKSGDLKGIAFVEFEDKNQAKQAIKYFNDKNNDFFKLGMRVRQYSLKAPVTIANQPQTTYAQQYVTQIPGPVELQQQYLLMQQQMVATSIAETLGGSHYTLQQQYNNQQNLEPHVQAYNGLNPTLPSSPPTTQQQRESIYQSAPTFNYSKEHKRKKRSNSKPEQPLESKWEPDPSSAEMRPKLNLLPRSRNSISDGSSSGTNNFVPIRQPRGPDGTRGFTGLGRGNLVPV